MLLGGDIVCVTRFADGRPSTSVSAGLFRTEYSTITECCGQYLLALFAVCVENSTMAEYMIQAECNQMSAFGSFDASVSF